MTAAPPDAPEILIDGRPLRIEDVVAVARAEARVVLSREPAFEARINRGADFVDRLIAEDGVVYGVSTGYGDSCTVAIPAGLVAAGAVVFQRKPHFRRAGKGVAGIGMHEPGAHRQD